jgi:hypothetical protein
MGVAKEGDRINLLPMNLQAVSALYRLPSNTQMCDLNNTQLVSLHEWADALHHQSGTALVGCYQQGDWSMLLSEWMDREVEAASQGSLNPQN